MPNQEEIERFLDSVYETKDGAPAPMRERLALLALRPLVAISAIRYLMGFPIVKVSTSGGNGSKMNWLFDSRRPWMYRGFISSYIELPSPLESYWRGTSKQNLRTRSHQARNAGYEVRAVELPEMDAVITQVFDDKGWETHEIERDLRKIRDSLDGVVCVGVFDPSEHAVAFCVGTRSGEVVRTLWSFASQRGTVRWLCFSGYVEEVNAKGGRVIVESPPWSFTGGNRIFAGHLGFVTARIRRM